jgi:hypothetical protein
VNSKRKAEIPLVGDETAVNKRAKSVTRMMREITTKKLARTEIGSGKEQKNWRRRLKRNVNGWKQRWRRKKKRRFSAYELQLRLSCPKK